MNFRKRIMALLSSLLLAAAPLSAAPLNPDASGGCGPAGSCPCEQCDCCVESSSGSAPEPPALPAATNPQQGKSPALTTALPGSLVHPSATPHPLLPASCLSQHGSPLPLFRRFCALLI